MPRRTWTYSAELGVDGFNQVSTIGGFLFGFSALIWLINIVKSAKNGAPAGPNPWNAHTIEWSMPSPPPHYNFPTLPVIKSDEGLWDDEHRDELMAAMAVVPDKEPEMPNPSYWPIVVAAGVTATWVLVMTGIWWVPLLGLGFTAFGTYMWAFEDPFAGGHS